MLYYCYEKLKTQRQQCPKLSEEQKKVKYFVILLLLDRLEGICVICVVLELLDNEDESFRRKLISMKSGLTTGN